MAAARSKRLTLQGRRTLMSAPAAMRSQKRSSPPSSP